MLQERVRPALVLELSEGDLERGLRLRVPRGRADEVNAEHLVMGENERVRAGRAHVPFPGSVDPVHWKLLGDATSVGEAEVPSGTQDPGHLTDVAAQIVRQAVALVPAPEAEAVISRLVRLPGLPIQPVLLLLDREFGRDPGLPVGDQEVDPLRGGELLEWRDLGRNGHAIATPPGD
jgi:hypothetical protein